MIMKGAALRAALREIEQERRQAAVAGRARYERVCDALPRIREIDGELAALRVNIAKMILKQENAEISAMEARTNLLTAEKNTLLFANGYDDSYFADTYKCTNCKDSGFVENAKCTCLTQRLISKYYEMSNLSQVIARENFDAFDISYYSEEIDPAAGTSPRDNINYIWSACLSFVENFDKKFTNLLLHGGTGLGKTFISNCIARELLDRGKTVLYVTAAQIFKMVEEMRFHRDDDMEPTTMQEMITGADLLIIDDLGTEFATILTSSELFGFINTRLLNRKSTIISTNLNPRHLEDQYSDRVVSRIFGEYTLLRFIGEDIRLQRKYSAK